MPAKEENKGKKDIGDKKEISVMIEYTGNRGSARLLAAVGGVHGCWRH